jgi:[ribosomal protein S5]-alanine N-acetyltransferase
MTRRAIGSTQWPRWTWLPWALKPGNLLTLRRFRSKPIEADIPQRGEKVRYVRPHEMPATVIATERLILRSALPQDFEPLFSSIFGDARVTQYLGGKPLGREEARTFFEDSFDHEGTGRKIGVLVTRSDGAVIGYAGLKPFDALGDEDYEIGFVLASAVWGRGYATEIGRAQLEYGFRTTGRSRLVAQVRPANAASAQALRKIGMTFLKEYERPGLGTWDIYVSQREA